MQTIPFVIERLPIMKIFNVHIRAYMHSFFNFLFRNVFRPNSQCGSWFQAQLNVKSRNYYYSFCLVILDLISVIRFLYFFSNLSWFESSRTRSFVGINSVSAFFGQYNLPSLQQLNSVMTASPLPLGIEIHFRLNLFLSTNFVLC